MKSTKLFQLAQRFELLTKEAVGGGQGYSDPSIDPKTNEFVVNAFRETYKKYKAGPLTAPSLVKAPDGTLAFEVSYVDLNNFKKYADQAVAELRAKFKSVPGLKVYVRGVDSLPQAAPSAQQDPYEDPALQIDPNAAKSASKQNALAKLAEGDLEIEDMKSLMGDFHIEQDSDSE